MRVAATRGDGGELPPCEVQRDELSEPRRRATGTKSRAIVMRMVTRLPHTLAHLLYHRERVLSVRLVERKASCCDKNS